MKRRRGTMPDVDPRPTSLSICSGIGGLDLATEVVFGARGVCYLEREAACVELLASRMEEGWLDPAPVHTDARTFDGRPWRGRVDLVTAGYPCQPFSFAGKGLAEADPRHLWPDIKRIVGEVQPAVVVLENVQGHLKRGFSTVLGDLDELRFDAEWGVYSASEAGYPHRRNRIFVLAYSRRWGLKVLRRCGVLDSLRSSQRNDADRCVPSVADAASDHWRSRERTAETGAGPHAQRWQRLASRGAELGHPDSAGLQGRIGPATERPHQCAAGPPGPEGDWKDVPEQYWPATEPMVRGVADEFPGRVDRLRALGNAVCPAQAVVALRDLVRRLG